MKKREVPKWSPRFSAGVTGQVVALLSTAQGKEEERTYLYLFLPIHSGMSHQILPHLPGSFIFCNLDHVTFSHL